MLTVKCFRELIQLFNFPDGHGVTDAVKPTVSPSLTVVTVDGRTAASLTVYSMPKACVDRKTRA